MSFLDAIPEELVGLEEEEAVGAAGTAGNGDVDEDGNPCSKSYTLSSTCIANLTYNHCTGELFMTFTDGRNYVIEDFPEIELERWLGSESIGGYFNAFVKGNY